MIKKGTIVKVIRHPVFGGLYGIVIDVGICYVNIRLRAIVNQHILTYERAFHPMNLSEIL